MLTDQLFAHLPLFTVPLPSSRPSLICAFKEGPLGFGGTSREGRGLFGGS